MSTTIDLSLDRIKHLVTRFPPYTRPTVHVTGTNGKGSVTAIVASILHESGLKVGRFNSPHLLYPRDSITIGRESVSEELYSATMADVKAANEGRGSNSEDAINASSFEVLTVAALRIFEKEQVDVAVVEVGMGGRLDATNILPLEGVVKVSAMTMVEIDHTRWLGSTVAAIAKEKAGIARRDTPFVLGPQKWKEVEASVMQHALAVGTTVLRSADVVTDYKADNKAPSQIPPQLVEVSYSPPQSSNSVHLKLALRGAHQLENLSTALAIIECLQQTSEFRPKISSDSIISGVARARWPGRLEFIQHHPRSPHAQTRTILLDGAHNASSSHALRQYISSIVPTSKPISFVLALSHSPPKTPLDTLRPLLRPGDRVAAIEFSPVEDMPWVVPVDSSVIQDQAKGLVGEEGSTWRCRPDRSLGDQVHIQVLREALAWASQSGGLVVVAGSLYLVADFYRLMEASPEEFKFL